jgi:hypothetical protein
MGQGDPKLVHQYPPLQVSRSCRLSVFHSCLEQILTSSTRSSMYRTLRTGLNGCDEGRAAKTGASFLVAQSPPKCATPIMPIAFRIRRGDH